MTETPEQAVDFQQIIANFKDVDLVLVEGFKHEALPKIQLHRKAVKKPLPELDEWTIATATDYPIERENRLDINDVDEVSRTCKSLVKKIKMPHTIERGALKLLNKNPLIYTLHQVFSSHGHELFLAPSR